MNRYVTQGLADDAASGKRVAACAARRSVVLDLFRSIAASLGDDAAKVRRANGAESITFPNGGRLTFHHAGAGLRGLEADVTFVHGWDDLSEAARVDLVVLASRGELIRACVHNREAPVSTTATTTITDFLLARIAEDEVYASDAHYEGQVWVPEEEAVVAADRDLDPVLFLDRKRDAAHAANWSPARALAECAAKRAIVEPHVGDNSEHPSPMGLRCVACSDTRHDGWWYEVTAWPCPTLRHLAAVYADHPDYRQEWKP